MKKLLVLVIAMLILTGCAVPSPAPTMTPSNMPRPTSTPTHRPKPTWTSLPTWTPKPTQTIRPTITAIPLQDPTFDEMIYFLNHNHINWNEYVAKGYTYVCHHFACDVCLAAREQGMRCAYVRIDFPRVAHAIIAFDTTDQGLIYFEPQVDKRMKVEVGRKYWSWIFWPEYDYDIDYDDTVTKITLYWDLSAPICSSTETTR